MATPTPQVLEAGDCPGCGTAYAQYQEYCIACGQRLAAVPGIGDALAAASGRRSSWSPGDWLWRVVALLVVALLAAAAVLAQRATREGAAETLVIATTAIGQEVLVASAGAATTEPSPTPAGEESAPVETTVTPPAKAGQRVTWPAGIEGFTVVLASVPERSRPGATRMAREASDAGVKDVGVLDSSEFSSLNPGYLVVFSGVFETRADAEAAIATARASGYNDAYAAEVAR